MNTVTANEARDSAWRLDQGDTTALFAASAGELPRLLHYGVALPEEEHTSVLAASQGGWPYGTLDQRAPAGLLPQAASCFGGHPAVLAHFDGQSLDAPLTLSAVRQAEASLCFVYANAALRIELSFTLHRGGALIAQSSLENLGESEIQIDWMAAASLELPAVPMEVESYHGRWGQELQRRRHALDEAAPVLENRRGRTSHQLFPGLLAGEPGFNPTHGRCFAMQLAWSGNTRLIAQRQFDGSAMLQAGVLYAPGEARLAAGQKLQTPELVFSVGEGSDACAWRYHDYAREQVLPRWSRTARPVHSNSWEAMYFDLDTAKLCQLVDAAAAIGAERFVLDDGWFQGRRDDTAGLGDWWVDRVVFPEGLQPLVDHVRAAGLQFGLWFEPEMVNADSELYRAHPDWVLRHGGAAMPPARQQWVLDIARPEVADYLFEKIAALVDEYGIDYIKWDMNRDLPAAGDGMRPRAAAQPEALYALLHRLNERFPALEIESCSSGGARLDLGVLAETGRVWTTDNNDPVDRFRIHQAASQFLPPEILGAHIGPECAHLTGRHSSVHTRAVQAMTGQFGFELDPRELSDDEADLLRGYAALYKQHREWLSCARLHRITGLWSGVVASAFVAADASTALLALLTERSVDGATAGRVVVPGLDAQAIYRIELVIADHEELQRRNRQMPAWVNSSVRLSGAMLATVGLGLPVLSTHAGLLILCEREK